jgi:hypothetical protein
MKVKSIILRVVCVMSFVLAGQSGASLYTGSLSSSDGGLMGVGGWVDHGVSEISWVVSQNEDMSWHYNYVLSVGETESAISHFILETSSTFTEDNIFNMDGSFGGIEIKTHLAMSSGSPDQPEDIYGIKFDETDGTTLTIDFDSQRDPIWGDFYAKAGGGKNLQQIWNGGITVVDPIVGASNGSFNNQILVPDTTTSMVPEPASMLLISLGALMIRQRPRKY